MPGMPEPCTGQVTLGFDFGKQRIGVAVGQQITGTATAICTLQSRDGKPDCDTISDLINEWQPDALVVGLPLHADGSESDMEKEVRAFGAKLAAVCGLPVLGSDERLTTEAADRVLASQDVHWRKRKDRRDSAAACIVLQDFLQAEEKAERIV